MNPNPRTHELIGRYFDLAGDEIELVLGAFEQRTLAGGEWLFRQNDPGDSLYFLVRGRLQVWIDREEEDGAAKQTMVGEVMPDETVGEISLLTGQPRTAGIRAARDSQLLEIDRAEFDRLAQRYPQMTMKLAGSIATRLQRRTSGDSAPARRLVNICLVPLTPGSLVDTFSGDLVNALGVFGSTLDLDPDNLGPAGAPVPSLDTATGVPSGLPAWLDEQEDRYRFVVYRAHPATSPWSRLAVRQADIVMLLGDSSATPDRQTWESLLDSEDDACRLAQHALVLVHPPEQKEIRGTRFWLEERDVDFHLHAVAGNERDVARVARVVAGRALGLVLGAGAARGFAHIGVYRALSEAGVEVDWIGGSSIGAILGAAMAMKGSPDAVHQAAHEGFVIGKPFSNYTLPLVSLLSGRRMMKATRKLLPGRIEDLPIPFFCLSSNLDSGSINIHTRGPIDRAVQATAAMPGALPPAVVDRHLAVDGAVLNGLPVDVMRRCPVGEVVAVDLSSRKTYEVEYEELPSAWALLRSRWLPFGRRYRVPGLVTLLLKSTEIGSVVRVREQGGQADLLLNPDVRKFGMTQTRAFERIVEAGYREAREKLPEWLSKREKAPEGIHAVAAVESRSRAS